MVCELYLYKLLFLKWMNERGSNYVQIFGIILIQCQFLQKGGLSWIIWVRNKDSKKFKWYPWQTAVSESQQHLKFVG